MSARFAQLALLFGLGSRLVELRWLGARRMSLFSSDLNVIETALGSSQVADLNCYLIVNPLRDDVITRRQVKRDSLFCPHRGQCSADVDVPCHDNVRFDLDPIKPTGTASTPEQRALALAVAQRLVAYLVAAGFPDPVAWVDSGNGIHIYFHADSFPNTHETDLLLTALYTCMARKFDSDAVKFDKSVRSAAQLMRLPGSYNFKAQRTCEITTFNEAAGVVTLEQVRAVVSDLRGQLGFKNPLKARPGSWTPGAVASFLQFYDIDYFPATEIPQGLLFVLNPCPLDSSHVATSSAILLTKSGRVKFCCKHLSCGGGEMPWRQFRAKMFRLTKTWFPTPKGVADAE